MTILEGIKDRGRIQMWRVRRTAKKEKYVRRGERVSLMNDVGRKNSGRKGKEM